VGGKPILEIWEKSGKNTRDMGGDPAYYRNTDYHTAQDTPDRLDYLRMAQVVQGVHAAVERLAR